MGRSNNTFNKNEREKKKSKKRQEKLERKREKKDETKSGALEDNLAYIDENGHIVDTPPEPSKKKIKASDIEIAVPKREKEDLTLERRGKVAFFNHDKGYGFIEQDSTQERFFVHQNNVDGIIEEGNKVRFSLEPGAKGLDAVNVKRV